MREKSNGEKYPEAWAFFEEEARNITGEDVLKHQGNYRIPVPDKSGDFIYTNTVEELWSLFIRAWYKPSINSESVYEKIQYIVTHF